MVQINLFAGQEYRRRRGKQICGHRLEGDGGTNWEIRIDIYTLPCVKLRASRTMLYSTRSSARCSVMT